MNNYFGFTYKLVENFTISLIKKQEVAKWILYIYLHPIIASKITSYMCV